MDLARISNNDLAGLLHLFHELSAGGNRVAFDLYVIIEREGTRRHQATAIADYQDNQLVETVQALISFVDDMRAKGVPDNQPGLFFVLEQLGSLIPEAQSRGLVQQIQ